MFRVICFTLLLCISLPLWADENTTLGQLQQATIDEPNSIKAWDRYGQALARSGRFSEANRAFSTALKIDPADKHTRYHMALAYAWGGDYAEAIRRYERLLKDHADDPAIRLDYGQTLAWNKQFDDARREYQAILNVHPQHTEAMRHLALLTAWETDYQNANQWIEQALQIAPDDARLYITLGEILTWKGDLQDAITAFEKSDRLTANNPDTVLKLAQAYEWLGRSREATDTHKRAITIKGDAVDAYIGLSRIYLQNRQYQLAEDVLRSASAQFPANQQISELVANLATAQKWNIKTVLHFIEPLLFVTVLLTLFAYIRKFGRVVPHHYTGAKALIWLLPVFTVVTIAAYGFSLFSGAYYAEAETVGQIVEIINIILLSTFFFVLLWLLRFGRKTRSQTVLAIGAHPDDIEFGCGASLLRLREEGCDTYGLILTAGLAGFASNEDPDLRLQEARASAKRLALNEVFIHDFPDTNLAEHKDRIKQVIEDTVKQLKPDIIFTHNDHDVHSDHRTVHDATREAARGAYTILSYENPNTPPSFKPNYFLDVGGYINDKISALAKHKSQADKTYTAPDVVRSNAGFRGSQAKVQYAEAFECIRVLDKVSAA